MIHRYESILQKGHIDKSLRVSIVIMIKQGEKYDTVYSVSDDSVKIEPSYILCISKPNPGPRICLSYQKYYTFAVLLEKTIKLIQKNLFALYPGVGSDEFEIDEKVLERFQKEKAMSGGGMTLVPSVYVDPSGLCDPGVRISMNDKNNGLTLALEDAIALNQLLKIFDPNQYSLTFLTKLIDFN